MKLEAEIHLTPLELAAAFCEMNDDDQARFFAHVALITESWPAHARLMQQHAIGRHISECECATEARELIAEIHSAMQEAA